MSRGFRTARGYAGFFAVFLPGLLVCALIFWTLGELAGQVAFVIDAVIASIVGHFMDSGAQRQYQGPVYGAGMPSYGTSSSYAGGTHAAAFNNYRQQQHQQQVSSTPYQPYASTPATPTYMTGP